MSELTESLNVEPACACADTDAYECFRLRYGLMFWESVDKAGGPCDCDCHDAREEKQP